MTPTRPDPAGEPKGGLRGPDDAARARAWFEDPLEVDRHLDGEGDPAERLRRDADLAALPCGAPEVARVVAGRRAFLEALRSARWAPGGVGAPELRALEQRVRAALRQDRETAAVAGTSSRFGRARPWLVGAAAMLAGVGTWLLHGRGGTAVAHDPYVAMAADVLHWKPQAFETCAAGGRSSADVNDLSLVRGGELQVSGCAAKPTEANASVAVLRRPEELPVVGYVAVPATGTTEKGVVGITEVEGGRVVVFDVLDHGRRVYLAVSAASLRTKSSEPGDRWSCAACHNPERRALPNPHKIVLRKAP